MMHELNHTVHLMFPIDTNFIKIPQSPILYVQTLVYATQKMVAYTGIIESQPAFQIFQILHLIFVHHGYVS